MRESGALTITRPHAWKLQFLNVAPAPIRFSDVSASPVLSGKGVLACHLGQHHITRMTLDQGRDIAVVRPGQQIAFPMARHRTIFNRRRSLTDRDDILDMP